MTWPTYDETDLQNILRYQINTLEDICLKFKWRVKL